MHRSTDVIPSSNPGSRYWRDLEARLLRFHPDDTGQGAGAGDTTTTTTTSGQGAAGGSTTPPAGQGAGAGDTTTTTTASGQGAAGGNGSQNDGQGAAEPGDGSDAAAALAARLAKFNNDASALLPVVFQENFQLRQARREKDAQIASLQQEINTYKQIGDAPTIQRRLRRSEIDRIAAKAGYTADVLADLDERTPGLAYEVKTEQVNGKAADRVYVTPPGGQATPLADYAASTWANYLPSLQAEAQPNGTAWTAQGTSGGNASGNLADDYLAKMNERAAARPNPLKATQ